MSMLFSRYRNRNRPAPVQGTVVVCGKNADYCALVQLGIMTPHVDMPNLNHDSISQYDVMAHQTTGQSFKSP